MHVMSRLKLPVLQITTGSKTMDAVLGGGLSTQSLTALHGGVNTGKTELM